MGWDGERLEWRQREKLIRKQFPWASDEKP